MSIPKKNKIQVFVSSLGQRQIKYLHKNISPIKGNLDTFLNKCKENAIRAQALNYFKIK